MTMSSFRGKRLMKELNLLINDPNVQSYFYYESSQIVEGTQEFILYGYLLPETIPYKYGAYRVSIRISNDYPFKPPKLDLLSYIYHPAVSDNTKNPTFDVGYCPYNWSPTIRLIDMIKLYVDIIDEPECEKSHCIMNIEAAELKTQNNVQYKQKAFEMVKLYSHPRPNQLVFSLKSLAKRVLLKTLIFNPDKINQLPLSNNLQQYLQVPFFSDSIINKQSH